MTRNSPLWWIGIFGSILTAAAQNQFDLVHRAFPSLGQEWDARLMLATTIIGVLSGLARMSPLALSEDSRLAGTADPSRTLPLLPSMAQAAKQLPEPSEHPPAPSPPGPLPPKEGTEKP